jgi:rRNA small subunit pseudouridine methyltransferase Nep1
LPTGCKKIGTSFHADQCVDVRQLAGDKPIVFVVGAMAHGKVIIIIVIFNIDCCLFKVDVDYTERDVAISQYPLSAALTCTKLCNAFEESWGIC